MKAIPYDNYIKSNIAYHLLYSVEIFKRLQTGETYDSIKQSYKENWKKSFIEEGKQSLINIKAIK